MCQFLGVKITYGQFRNFVPGIYKDLRLGRLSQWEAAITSIWHEMIVSLREATIIGIRNEMNVSHLAFIQILQVCQIVSNYYKVDLSA